LFKAIFRKQIKEREKLAGVSESVGADLKPEDETEAIENVLKRIDELKASLLEEQKQKKEGKDV
jgi:hypothetical protein